MRFVSGSIVTRRKRCFCGLPSKHERYHHERDARNDPADGLPSRAEHDTDPLAGSLNDEPHSRSVLLDTCRRAVGDVPVLLGIMEVDLDLSSGTKISEEFDLVIADPVAVVRPTFHHASVGRARPW